MSVCILVDKQMAAFYCSTRMKAFGPIIVDPKAREVALEFLRFLGPVDLRNMSDREISDSLVEFNERRNK